MLRTVGPDGAIFDAVIPAGLDGPVQHVLTPGAIVGMNRRQQVLVRERLARLAAQERLASIGGFKLLFREMQFERAEMAGVHRGLQQAFAFGEVIEDGARLILAAPAPDGRADHARQCGRMERTFDEGDVAESLSEPHGVGIAFGAAALMGQQHERKIRP